MATNPFSKIVSNRQDEANRAKEAEHTPPHVDLSQASNGHATAQVQPVSADAGVGNVIAHNAAAATALHTPVESAREAAAARLPHESATGGVATAEPHQPVVHGGAETTAAGHTASSDAKESAQHDATEAGRHEASAFASGTDSLRGDVEGTRHQDATVTDATQAAGADESRHDANPLNVEAGGGGGGGGDEITDIVRLRNTVVDSEAITDTGGAAGSTGSTTAELSADEIASFDSATTVVDAPALGATEGSAVLEPLVGALPEAAPAIEVGVGASVGGAAETTVVGGGAAALGGFVATDVLVASTGVGAAAVAGVAAGAVINSEFKDEFTAVDQAAADAAAPTDSKEETEAKADTGRQEGSERKDARLDPAGTSTEDGPQPSTDTGQSTDPAPDPDSDGQTPVADPNQDLVSGGSDDPSANDANGQSSEPEPDPNGQSAEPDLDDPNGQSIGQPANDNSGSEDPNGQSTEVNTASGGTDTTGGGEDDPNGQSTEPDPEDPNGQSVGEPATGSTENSPADDGSESDGGSSSSAESSVSFGGDPSDPSNPAFEDRPVGGFGSFGAAVGQLSGLAAFSHGATPDTNPDADTSGFASGPASGGVISGHTGSAGSGSLFGDPGRGDAESPSAAGGFSGGGAVFSGGHGGGEPGDAGGGLVQDDGNAPHGTVHETGPGNESFGPSGSLGATPPSSSSHDDDDDSSGSGSTITFVAHPLFQEETPFHHVTLGADDDD